MKRCLWSVLALVASLPHLMWPNSVSESLCLKKRPFVGGRITQLYKYFPKLCFPTCGQEINQRRIKANKNLTILTQAEVANVAGVEGDYQVSVVLKPRYVNDNCTACGDCAKAVRGSFDDDFNYGLGHRASGQRKGAYLPYNLAYPQRYVLDPAILGTEDADRAKSACRFDAIDLTMQEETVELKVGAIIWATGWQPYDAAKIQPYGYDRYDNVVTSVEFERMMDPFGPTGGRLLRPSDDTEAKNVAFIQCAGSRDENHLRHCSRICCMASLKQSTYLGEQFGDKGHATIYYIDIRAIDRFEDFYRQIQADKNTTFIKSKVAHITEDDNDNPVLHGVDTEGCQHYSTAYDLAVLAIGMQPSGGALPAEVRVDYHGYIERHPDNGGIFAAGCAADALDVNRSVQSASAAALRAIQVINRSASVER